MITSAKNRDKYQKGSGDLLTL
ncbi:Protein CBG25306 [Caenorhabditis briggsae]|uniref:Protein CBG25306 n=1 Tax=Caenorhabditis briggsae TaxID=6238 RepID=B6IIH6_CAEBR|nr:Protein CBG25306 [Caenorhabditis briggsae]CAR99706.1 Protein CBG25306 [Caenorhabditis briggsae]